MLTSSSLSLQPKRLSNVNNDDDNSLQTIVFSLADIEQTSMGKYLFALPVAAVVKAIVYPADKPILKDGIGMLNLGDLTVTIVDLRHKFTTIDPTHDSSGFALLFHTHAGELCALPIKDAPVLLDINPITIKPIPLAYREVNQLSFASHLAIVPQSDNLEPLQILLLGMGNFTASTPTIDRN
jgi:chemotaxis signal transduction protein